jgi:hypothetical protein
MQCDGNCTAVVTEWVGVVSIVGEHVVYNYMAGDPLQRSVLWAFIVLHAMWDSVLGLIIFSPIESSFFFTSAMQF